MSCPGSKTGRSGVTLIEMMIVVTIIALITGISFPALSSGLAGVRLTSAAGSLASFLTSSMNQVERHEKPAAIVISPRQNLIARYTGGEKPDATLELPAGISLEGAEGEEPRRFILMPGGTAPRITVVLRNERGARRSVQIDPVTGVPSIKRLDETK